MAKLGFPVPPAGGAPAAPTSGWAMGKPGFPTCGEPVEPHPCRWGASRPQPRLGHGETGFPRAPAHGEGVGGVARPRCARGGAGKPGFPVPLPVGRQPLPTAVGPWGNRVSPCPLPVGRQPLPTAVGPWGNRVSPCPCPRGGCGRAQPCHTVAGPRASQARRRLRTRRWRVLQYAQET